MKLFEKIFGKSHETKVAESRQRAAKLNEIYSANEANRAYKPEGKPVTILILDPEKQGFAKKDGYDRLTGATDNGTAYLVPTSKGPIEVPYSGAVTKEQAKERRVWFEVAKPHSHNQGSTHLLANVQFPITEREWPSDFNGRPENHYNGVIRH